MQKWKLFIGKNLRMLFHLAYRPLPLDDLEGHRDVTNFLPMSVKYYLLVVYRFLIKNGGSISALLLMLYQNHGI